ncbi:MAG TPA: hypothetical protein VHZ03_48205, partial [Trebonia sp.]|nr:hypothetical protein [Trebonia sp.]
MIDAEPDESALDDGQLALVPLPAGAGGEPLVQPAPGRRRRGAVPGSFRHGDRRRVRPGRGIGEPERGPVPG